MKVFVTAVEYINGIPFSVKVMAASQSPEHMRRAMLTAVDACRETVARNLNIIIDQAALSKPVTSFETKYHKFWCKTHHCRCPESGCDRSLPGILMPCFTFNLEPADE